MDRNDLGWMEFCGRYGDNVDEEMNKYCIVGGVVGGEEEFDIIEWEEWLSYGGGIDGKEVCGKGVVIDVEGREFEGRGGNVNGSV